MTKSLLRLLCVSSVFAASTWAHAEAPAGAPAGSTATCKDGTFYSGETRRGACKGHQGVKDWYGTTEKAAAPAAKPDAKAEVAATPAPASAPAAKPAPMTKAAAGSAAAAPGGGPGMVWVNAKTKVYHCPGDRWYGKTKTGEYMTEANATAKGAHPEHGKACAK